MFAGRDAAQVPNWQNRIQTSGPLCHSGRMPSWTGFARIPSRFTVANLRPRHLDRTGAALECSRRPVTMPRHTGPSVGELQIPHCVKARNVSTWTSTACARSYHAPARRISVSGSAKVPGWESWKTLVLVRITPAVEKWRRSGTPTIRRLTPSSRRQLLAHSSRPPAERAPSMVGDINRHPHP